MKKKIDIIIKGILVPLIIYVGISLFTKYTIEVFFKDNNSLNSILEQSIANVILIIIFVPLYFADKKNIIKNNPIKFGKIMYLIPLGFSLCIICNVSLSFFFDISKNAVSNGVSEVVADYGILFSTVLVAVIVPIVEEILFRGFFYDAIYKVSNTAFAMIITSILFALAHGNIEQGIYAFVAGLVLSYIRYKYRSVIYSMIMHLIMNVSTILFAPSILMMPKVIEKLFMLLIMVVVFLLSLFRINDNKFSLEVI